MDANTIITSIRVMIHMTIYGQMVFLSGECIKDRIMTLATMAYKYRVHGWVFCHKAHEKIFSSIGSDRIQCIEPVKGAYQEPYHVDAHLPQGVTTKSIYAILHHHPTIRTVFIDAFDYTFPSIMRQSHTNDSIISFLLDRTSRFRDLFPRVRFIGTVPFFPQDQIHSQ